MRIITIRVSLDASYAALLMPATGVSSRPSAPTHDRTRTAKIRGLCASAVPRITRRDVADETDLSIGTVKNVLSDNAPWDTRDSLDKIEAAVKAIIARRVEAHDWSEAHPETERPAVFPIGDEDAE